MSTWAHDEWVEDSRWAGDTGWDDGDYGGDDSEAELEPLPAWTPLPRTCTFRYRAVRRHGVVYPTCGAFMANGVCPNHGYAWHYQAVES